MMQTIGDMPTFASSSYASQAYGLAGHGLNALNQASADQQLNNVIKSAMARQAALNLYQPKQQQQETSMTTTTRRIVQVIVADPNENVPLDKCLLYKGEAKLTDATDQELYFELAITEMLKTHNEFRITCKDKAVKERVEMLEPAKVRDLKLIVVTIANL